MLWRSIYIQVISNSSSRKPPQAWIDRYIGGIFRNLLPVSFGLSKDILEGNVHLFSQIASLQSAPILLKGEAGAFLYRKHT